MPQFIYTLCLTCLFMLAGCGSPVVRQNADTGDRSEPIYVMAGGWHTNITVEAAAIRPWLHPQLQQDFKHARYLRFGWGDGDYYPSTTPTRMMALRALFASRYPVLRVIGSPTPPALSGTAWETLRVDVSQGDMQQLADYINRSLQTAPRGALLRESHFSPDIDGYYRSSGHYGAFYTCNSWTLDALRAAGLPVHGNLRLTRESAMRQLRPLASTSTPEAAILVDDSQEESSPHAYVQHQGPLVRRTTAGMAPAAQSADAPRLQHR